MKFTNILKSIILSILFTYSSINICAQNINTPENFPGRLFRGAIEKIIGVEPGGSFTAGQAAEVTRIDIPSLFDETGSVTDLTGLQFFPALRNFNCSSNQITSIDLSHNTALEVLRCSGNPLTNLDLSHNTALKRLNCNACQLTNLDVSHNTALDTLHCKINHLSSLDVSNNVALERFDCSENQLIHLNVTGATPLRFLLCSENQLSSLDLSQNTALKSLTCDTNHLTVLDLSNNTIMAGVWCSYNRLTNIVISESGAISFLDCSNNHLTSLSSFVSNPSLGQDDTLIVTNNYIGCADPNTALHDIEVLKERMGTGFRYDPQKECETGVEDWSLH